MELYVIQYEGLDHKKDNDERTKSIYLRDCGLNPVRILDEPSRDELVHFLMNTSFNDETILHFISHGSLGNGIVQKLPKSESGDKASLISWQEIATLFQNITISCPRLYVNLGTVCNSNDIMSFLEKRDFILVVTNRTVSNPVEPKKINKEFVKLSKGEPVNPRNIHPDYSLHYETPNV